MGDTENKIPLRSEVAVENTWALEDLYATDDDWKADMERLKSMMQQIPGQIKPEQYTVTGFPEITG